MPTLSANGIRMAYERRGAGEPVLLLHGGLVSKHSWEPQLAALAEHYEVIACDLRGHGESSVTRAAYSVELFAEDVVALLDALDKKRVHLCGHSLGGMVAQRLAISYPARVRSLVLAETSYSTSSTPLEALTVAVAKLAFRLTSVGYFARLSARVQGKHTPEVGPYLELEIGRHAADKSNYLNIWRAVFAADSRAQLEQIACPTLVLVGEHYRQTHAQARKMTALIPNAHLVTLPKAGHMLTWDNPEAFNETVVRFFGHTSHARARVLTE